MNLVHSSVVLGINTVILGCVTFSNLPSQLHSSRLALSVPTSSFCVVMAIRLYSIVLLVVVISIGLPNASPISTASTEHTETQRLVSNSSMARLVRAARKIDLLASIVNRQICCHCLCDGHRCCCVCNFKPITARSGSSVAGSETSFTSAGATTISQI